MPLHLEVLVAEAVKQAMRRAARVAHTDMSRGLYSLATIASVAPLLGLSGTILGILNSFPGCGAERSTCMAAMAERLSWSLVPTALGLFVAVSHCGATNT